MTAIGILLKEKSITQEHASKLLDEVLGTAESERDLNAESQWEKNRRG